MNCGLFLSNIHSHCPPPPPLWTRFSDGVAGELWKSFPRRLTVTAPLIFGIFLRGVRKIDYFCGGRQGYCVSTFDLFSFLSELIRHSDPSFQKQHKGTSVYGVWLSWKPLWHHPNTRFSWLWSFSWKCPNMDYQGVEITWCAERNNWPKPQTWW